MKRLSALLLVLLFVGCVDPNSSSNYDCSYYGDCGYDHDYQSRHPYYEDRYRGDRDRLNRERRELERERERAERERERYERQREREHDRWERNRERDRQREEKERERDERHREREKRPHDRPTPPPNHAEIKPHCPAGTEFTGRTCKITDSKLRKKGGDGNINPCPSGMWVSGDRCVK